MKQSAAYPEGPNGLCRPPLLTSRLLAETGQHQCDRRVHLCGEPSWFWGLPWHPAQERALEDIEEDFGGERRVDGPLRQPLVQPVAQFAGKPRTVIRGAEPA